MKLVKNPYQPPKAPQDPVKDKVVVPTSWLNEVWTGVKVAIRWVGFIVLPILVLILFGVLFALVFRGISTGSWPSISSIEFWLSMAGLILSLVACFMVVCFWVGLFAVVVYSIRYWVAKSYDTEMD